MKLRNLRTFWLCAALACSVFVIGVDTQTPAKPKPKHINRALELLESGQPIYYTGSHSGTAGTFEQGKADATTYADYLSYDMEHAPFDVHGLSEYMKGLAAAGPTRSGHRTPAVIVNVPVNGTDEATVRANAWMFSQVLATGVHGVLLTHADTPGAVRAFVEACRLPIHKQGIGISELQEGRRGAHGAPTAAAIWGITPDEYYQKADAWPLNPNGELLLGSTETVDDPPGPLASSVAGPWTALEPSAGPMTTTSGPHPPPAASAKRHSTHQSQALPAT